MKVESMIANTPSDSALFRSGSTLICLTFDTQIHDVISADGAVVDHNIPSPESDCVPLEHVSTFYKRSVDVVTVPF